VSSLLSPRRRHVSRQHAFDDLKYRYQGDIYFKPEEVSKTRFTLSSSAPPTTVVTLPSLFFFREEGGMPSDATRVVAPLSSSLPIQVKRFCSVLQADKHAHDAHAHLKDAHTHHSAASVAAAAEEFEAMDDATAASSSPRPSPDKGGGMQQLVREVFLRCVRVE